MAENASASFAFNQEKVFILIKLFAVGIANQEKKRKVTREWGEREREAWRSNPPTHPFF